MKKILLFASALAGLFLAGCQRENLEPVQADKQVTFTIEAPAAMQTKAIADGLNVDELIYEVWITGQSQNVTDLSGATKLYQAKTDKKTVADGKVSFKITLDLVNDQNFTVLFWAQKKGINVYNTANLTGVTYTSTAPNAYSANDNQLDAFYGKAFVSDGQTATPTVTLKRPFAQVNLCTLNNKDAAMTSDNYNISLVSSKMRLDAVPTTFNVATSAVSNYVAMEFAANTVPSGDDKMITVNDKKYFYAGMNYVFAGANIVLTYDIQTKLNGAVDANVNNTIQHVPLKENYRTNIVGNLLTSKVDYEIIVDAAFNEPAEVVELWDGESVTEPKKNADDQYVIKYPSELAWLAAAVNGTLPPVETKALEVPKPNSFAGETFVLANDVDLNGKEWTPIGYGNNRFSGTFDGQGHTIYGLTINTYPGQHQAALFGNLAGTITFKNLTIEGAEIRMPADHTGDFYGAALIATAYGHVTVQNVTVKDSYISGNNKVAGILAHDGGMSSLNIEECHVDGCVIESLNEQDGGNVGGLVGLFNSNFEATIQNSSVKNTEINAINSTNTGKRSNGQFVGCMGGKDNAVINIIDCEVSGNTFTQNEGVTYVSPYGVFVGGNRDDNGKGKVIVDNAIVVATAAQLQIAVNNAAKGTNNIVFGADITGDVAIPQNAGIIINVDGCDFKYDGTITVNAQSDDAGVNPLVIRNINFRTTASEEDFIYSVQTNYYPHIEVYGCAFEGPGANSDVVPVKIKGAKNFVMADCTATKVHSLIQNTAGWNLNVRNCEVTEAGRGMSLGSVQGATVENVKIDALDTKYGIRIDAQYENTATIKNCEISAFIPVVVRNAETNYNLVFEGTNTMTQANTDGIWCAIGTSEYETNGTMPSAATGKVKVDLKNANLNNSGIYGAYWPPVAKVGNTEYSNIDEAISAWAGQNNSTLTLLADVTLSDVIKISSTEMHTLDLGTYTLTGAKGKNAIEIINNGRASASYALDIKADATNPGGITASSAVVKTTGKSGVKDRPIIRFYNGVFNASNIISHSGSNGTNCPQFQFHSGVYNANLSANRALIQIYGGTFNGKFYISVDSSAYALISGGKFKYLDNLYGSALNSDKFTIGSSKGNFDRGVYVDDEGYIVVGGPVITEFGDKFAAKTTNISAVGSYLPYSSAAEHGLYYTNAQMAIEKHKDKVVLK